MHSIEKPFLGGRNFIFSIQKGQDLLQTLESFCHHNQIKCAIINGIGAVEKATVGIYDQKAKKYVKINIDKEMEILSLSGNVSLFEDRPMIHVHITLSGIDGKAWGGHLMAEQKSSAAKYFFRNSAGQISKSARKKKQPSFLSGQTRSALNDFRTGGTRTQSRFCGFSRST
mgnify:CR=1 FL=1